jgi:DNA polymerase-3 subunit delta'
MAKRPGKDSARSIPPAAADASAYDFQPLEDILGQPRAVASLRAALASGRLHHAWIFHGPRGVGKFSTAVAFAAVLLDPTTAPDLAGDPRPDPESETQRLIRAAGHPDLHIVRKELAAVSREPQVRASKQTVIAKDVVDEFLVEPAQRTRILRSDSAAAKVFIVDEAELIDARTQNALLKVMEEPAPGSMIILIASQEDRLLPTLRSRSQRIAFRPLDDDAMNQWLGRSGLELSSRQRDWLLTFAAGSPGEAKEAAEHNLYEWHETLSPLFDAAIKAATGRAAFPIELGATMGDLVDERAAATVAGDKRASKDAANKAWARRMLAFAARHARTHLSAAADPHQAEAAAQVIDAIVAAEAQIQSNVNLKLVMENLAAQMAGASAATT